MISSHFLRYILLISTFLWIACESPQDTQSDNTSSSSKATNSETSTTFQAPQTRPNPPHTMPTITQHDKVSYQIFETDTPKGFGYDILIGKKKFLHQPNIPAINGYKAFKQREDAEKVASLVVFKITNNIMPPSISLVHNEAFASNLGGVSAPLNDRPKNIKKLALRCTKYAVKQVFFNTFRSLSLSKRPRQRSKASYS